MMGDTEVSPANFFCQVLDNSSVLLLLAPVFGRRI